MDATPPISQVNKPEPFIHPRATLANNVTVEPFTTIYENVEIDKVRFKQKVVPGDTLVFHLKFISPIRRGLCHMEAKAYVRGKVVAEGELMAQIINTKAREQAEKKQPQQVTT